PIVCLASPNLLVGAQENIGNFHPAILEHYALWNAEIFSGVLRRNQRMERNDQNPAISAPPAVAAEDERLVQDCINGDEQAWNRLIDKYKRLIYSIPVKYGFSPDDAADVFQSVCVELFTNLSKLRKIESLRLSMITVA